MLNKESTLDFYNSNAKAYSDSTQSINLLHVIARFTKYIDKSASILDVGCGSGRDLKAFKEMGYSPSGLELSPVMASIAKEHSGCDVEAGDILEFETSKKYNAVWCCNSLVHLTATELKSALFNIYTLLNEKGILFLSLKKGDGPYTDKLNRFMNSYQKTYLLNILEQIGFHALETCQEEHAIKDRNEVVLNFIVRRNS